MTVAELRDQLSALLSEIEAGRLDASPTLRARVEGAVIALDAVVDGRADAVLDRLAAGLS